MHENHQYTLGCYAAVNQLALSLQAAKAVEHQRAIRELKLARRTQRRQRRAVRRGQEAYTTAV